MQTLEEKLFPLLDGGIYKDQEELENKIEEIYNKKIIKGSKWYFWKCMFFTELAYDYIESRNLNIPIFLPF